MIRTIQSKKAVNAVHSHINYVAHQNTHMHIIVIYCTSHPFLHPLHHILYIYISVWLTTSNFAIMPSVPVDPFPASDDVNLCKVHANDPGVMHTSYRLTSHLSLQCVRQCKKKSENTGSEGGI